MNQCKSRDSDDGAKAVEMHDMINLLSISVHVLYERICAIV